MLQNLSTDLCFQNIKAKTIIASKKGLDSKVLLAAGKCNKAREILLIYGVVGFFLIFFNFYYEDSQVLEGAAQSGTAAILADIPSLAGRSPEQPALLPSPALSSCVYMTPYNMFMIEGEYFCSRITDPYRVQEHSGDKAPWCIVS